MPGSNLSFTDMKQILQIRIRDMPVRTNFGNAFASKKCPFEECDEEESQQHLFESYCWLRTGEMNAATNNDTEYSDVYDDNHEKQFEVMTTIFNKLKHRDEVIRRDGPWDSRKKNSAKQIQTLVIRKATRKKINSKKKKPNKQNIGSIMLK